METDSSDKVFLMPEGKGELSTFNTVLVAPTDKSVLLWRYIDLAKLVALFGHKKLYFARADTFDDTHEGSITDRMSQDLTLQFSERNQLRSTIAQFRKQHRECMFMSCWCFPRLVSGCP